LDIGFLGNTIDLAGIPLTSFAGEQSLRSDNAGTFIPTPQSGAARANAPGQIVANALEASNTDISAQFSTMIQTQQAYTANTKVVTASNEMLQTLTSMIL
jgi:flagellar hook protein FlgE